jgi:arylsulfatase A-like enzyme
MKRALAWIIFAAAVTVAGVFGRELAWEWRFQTESRPQVEPAPLQLPPCENCNLIVISMDTLRADYAARMPRLQEIAGQSVDFTRAYTNAFYTTPSHMTLFTGLYPNRHLVGGRNINLPRALSSPADSSDLDPQIKTMTEVLAGNGYQTVWFAAQHLKHLDPALGFGRGFAKFTATPFARPGRANGSLDERELKPALAANGRFFYFLHSYVTHAPYLLNNGKFPLLFGLSDMARDYFRSSDRWKRLPKTCASLSSLASCLGHTDWADIFLHEMGSYQLRVLDSTLQNTRDRQRVLEQKAALHEAYRLSTQDLDRQLGQFWDLFKSSGRGRDTLVVLFSDHGEELYEHGQGSHSSFHEHTARVPLILFHPRLAAPVRSNALVSLVDVWPTLAAVLNVKPPTPLQGQNLGALHPARAVFGFSLGSDLITDGTWKLLRGAQGVDELYYLPTDPREEQNLAEYRWPRIKRALARLREERRRLELGL